MGLSHLPSAPNLDQKTLTRMEHVLPVAGVVKHGSASQQGSQGLHLLEKGLECHANTQAREPGDVFSESKIRYV